MSPWRAGAPIGVVSHSYEYAGHARVLRICLNDSAPVAWLLQPIGHRPQGSLVYKNSYITDERHISRIDSQPVESTFVPASGTRDALSFIVFSLPGPWPGEFISGWEFVHWQ